jgi:penicillin-binding protein 2
MLMVVVGCLFAALVVRLWYLQVLAAPAARAVAADQGVVTIYTTAPRGEILDRNGNILVGNRQAEVIEVDRDLATASMERRLAPLLGLTVPQLAAAIANPQYQPYQPVPVMTDPDPGQVLYIREHPRQFPGVTVSSESVPYYTPEGMAAANLLGYVGPITQSEYDQLKSKGYRLDSQIGQSGLEAAYQDVLRGQPGVEKVQVNAQGQVLSVLSSTPPVPGDNIRLSISGRVQLAALQALEQEAAIKHGQVDPDGSGYYRATGGAVVVEDPSTGQLLALATYPTYDPDWFVGGISTTHYAELTSPAADSPLEDRAISGEYFPGSTFKLVTATAGLDSGVITPNSLFDDHGGGLLVAGHFFYNDGHQSWGEVALPEALTVSDDAYFYNIGATLYFNPSRYGTNFFQQVAAGYGFGQPTGIALPGEASGYVLTPAEKAALHRDNPNAYPFGTYYVGDAVESAIGQDDVAVTPLQEANAYSAFANGGTLWQPSLVLDAQTPTGQVVHTFSPVKIGSSPPLTPQARQAMVAGFLGVTSNPDGTAYYSFGATHYPIPVAGKTGTAQPVSGIPHTSPAYKQYTSVFASFAPANAPQYVVDCFMSQAGYGADAAAPVVRQVYDVLFNQPILPAPLSGY